MGVTLLTDKSLEDMKSYCLEHPEIYQSKGPDPASFGSFEYPDFDVTSNYPQLKDANDKEELWETDYENSLLIFRFFGNNRFPVSLMNDERYMAHLANFEYFSYMKRRWPIGGQYVEGRIRSQYFFGRAPYARHGILRLFWPAYLVAQANKNGTKEEFEKKLLCYFRNRLALDRVLERNFSRNYDLLDCCIEAFLNTKDESEVTGKHRSGILGKCVNNALSVTSLDSMTKPEAYELIHKIVEDIAAGKYDFEASPDEDDENNGD